MTFCWGFYSRSIPTSSVRVIPNLVRNLFSLLSSLLRILKRVQDDNLFSFFCHSEFISESFSFYSRPSNRSWNKFRMTICSPSSVIPNLFRNLLSLPLGPSYGSWNKFRMTICSPSSVIPNLVRNLLFLPLGPFQRSWNKFRMTNGGSNFFLRGSHFFFMGGKAPRKLSPSIVGENENLWNASPIGGSGFSVRPNIRTFYPKLFYVSFFTSPQSVSFRI